MKHSNLYNCQCMTYPGDPGVYLMDDFGNAVRLMGVAFQQWAYNVGEIGVWMAFNNGH